MRVRITRVEYAGIKETDRAIDLDERTALVGPPASGKTSILEAVKFAATGLVPHLGGDEASTAKIMRGERMDSKVHLSDGRWFSRSLTRVKGALKGEARCSWLPDTANSTAHGEAIRSLFGASKTEACQHLDLRQLFDAPPAERQASVDALLAATSMSPEQMETELRDDTAGRLAVIKDGRLQPMDPAIAEALDRLLPEVIEEVRARGITPSIDFAKAKKNATNLSLKQKTGARAELENRAMGLRAPTETLDALNARRQKGTDQIAALRAQKKIADEGAAALALAEKSMGRAVAVAGDLAERRNAIALLRLNAKIANEEAEKLVEPPAIAAPAYVVPDPKILKGADAADERASAEEVEAKKKIPAAVRAADVVSEPSTEAAEQKVERAEQDLEQARSGPWAKVLSHAAAISKRLMGTPQMQDCGTHLGEISKLCEENGGDLRTRESALSKANAALKVTKALYREARKKNTAEAERFEKDSKAHDAAMEACAKHRTAALELRQKARTMRQEALEAAEAKNGPSRERYEALCDAREVEVDRVRRERRKLMSGAADAVKTAETKQTVLADVERDLAAAAAALEAARKQTPAIQPGYDAAILKLVDEQSSIDEQKRSLAGVDARKREMETIAGEIAVLQSSGAVYAAAEWALQRLRERDLASRGGPIVERMLAFLRGAGRTEEPYLRAAKGQIDFGWRVAGTERPLAALSGGETVMFMAALASAVIGLRAPAVRVLMIEAAELGNGEYAAAVMRGVDAVAEGLDTVILATCVDVEVPGGWQVHLFERKALEVA